ncbi:BatA and WFA domain-containing protein [Verrucomicrobiales bacterium BCK34]|nr:BatA and WFA domain-containing protein [Verrucomicrobiales bacterium BCK34]
MQFLQPASLWLLLLGIIPVMLYLFRRRSKKVSVSTLVFFKTLAREHQESAWLRRLKKLLSFVLTILVFLFAVFVLSRIVASSNDADEYRSIVVLLDRSASMAVADEDGETRLDAGKRILKERLKLVPEEISVSLVAYDIRPEVVQPGTTKRRELISRLDGVAIRPIPDRADLAQETAKLLAGLEPPTAIWHVSDKVLDAAAFEDSNVSVRELNLALDSVSNAGITAFEIRPVPLEYARYDAYVQVALNEAAPEADEVRLNVSVGGIPSQFREIDLEPGGKKGVTFRINGSRDQILKLELKSDGDEFALDNVVAVPLPDPKPVLAAWIRPDDAEDPYTRFALSSIQESGSFELLKGGPDSWPLSEEVDAVIFDGWLPEQWPTEIPVIVINPPGALGPVFARRLDAAIPYDQVRVGNEEHPVLFRISSSRLALTQTALLQANGSLEPLWFAGKDPILAAGEVEGQRLVVMGFSPGLSERLPLTASFPLLMGNALFWAVDRQNEGRELGAHFLSTGELAEVEGSEIRWTSAEEGQGGSRRLELESDVVEMSQIGIWETDSGMKGAAHLLSARESNIAARPEIDPNDSEYFAVASRFTGNLKWWFLSFIILFLVVESWLFHRHAVY